MGNIRWRNSFTAAKTRPDADCGTDHEIKNTKSSKNAQKRDIENISEEYKETVRQKLAKINPQGKDSENLWQEIRDTTKEAASNIQKIPRKMFYVDDCRNTQGHGRKEFKKTLR